MGNRHTSKRRTRKTEWCAERRTPKAPCCKRGKRGKRGKDGQDGADATVLVAQFVNTATQTVAPGASMSFPTTVVNTAPNRISRLPDNVSFELSAGAYDVTAELSAENVVELAGSAVLAWQTAATTAGPFAIVPSQEGFVFAGTAPNCPWVSIQGVLTVTADTAVFRLVNVSSPNAIRTASLTTVPPIAPLALARLTVRKYA